MPGDESPRKRYLRPEVKPASGSQAPLSLEHSRSHNVSNLHTAIRSFIGAGE